jgi:hypothetical protein
MLKGPKIRLAVDLHRIGKYFPLEENIREGFDYDLIVDRTCYDGIADILKSYRVSDDHVIRELCFILLWLEREIQTGDERNNPTGKFYQMSRELDELKDYLLQNRVTSIRFSGEYKRNEPGDEFTVKEDINIDRICDGIRSVFREEFQQDKQKRRTKGLTAWQRRKMTRIRNNFLNYFSAIPFMDDLSLEDQNHLIDKLSFLAGITE